MHSLSLVTVVVAVVAGISDPLNYDSKQTDALENFDNESNTKNINDTKIMLQIYERVQENEARLDASNDGDPKILQELIEMAKTTGGRKLQKGKKLQTKHGYNDPPLKKKQRRLTKIRREKSAVSSLWRSQKKGKPSSHVKLYWEKRLQRAPKNVMSEELFRNEYKRTTPPPTRKGEGTKYKPTTLRPVSESITLQHPSMYKIESNKNLEESPLEDIPVEVSAMVTNNLQFQEIEDMRPKKNKTFIEPSFHKPSYYTSPVFPNFPQVHQPIYLYPRLEGKIENHDRNVLEVNTNDALKNYDHEVMQLFKSPKMILATDSNAKNENDAAPVVSSGGPIVPLPPYMSGYQSSALPPPSITIKPFLGPNYQTVNQPFNRPSHQIVTNSSEPLHSHSHTPNQADASKNYSHLLFHPKSTKDLDTEREVDKLSIHDKIFVEDEETFPDNSIDKRKSDESLQKGNAQRQISKSNFVTTPLPRHGPSNTYEYTTRHSFVNVQFGGNSAVSKAYPFAQNLGINTGKAHRTLNPPVVKSKYEYRTSDHPVASTSGVTPSPQWREISKYHLATNSDQMVNHLFSPSKHYSKAKVATSPTVLPPLTPAPSKIFTGQNLPKIPAQRNPIPHSFNYNQNHPTVVTLPPYIHYPNSGVGFQAASVPFNRYSRNIAVNNFLDFGQKDTMIQTNNNYLRTVKSESADPLKTMRDIKVMSHLNPKSLPASENSRHALKFPSHSHNEAQLGAELQLRSRGQNYKMRPAIKFVEDDILHSKDLNNFKDPEIPRQEHRRIRFPV